MHNTLLILTSTLLEYMCMWFTEAFHLVLYVAAICRKQRPIHNKTETINVMKCSELYLTYRQKLGEADPIILVAIEFLDNLPNHVSW